ncbi:glycosyltransferase [Vibrio metschnikovii]|nr:glycosyltransferase [Vibrio metschnikovii]
MRKLVSVYITTHNRKELLTRAIKSVLAQDYDNTEIIVVDDASSDGTEVFMETIISKHNNVRYFRTEVPKGACYNRNIAIKNSRGYYITGLDDDDYFSTTRISDLVSEFDEKKYSCISSAIIGFDNNGLKKKVYGYNSIININKLMHFNHIGNQVLTTKKRLIELDGFDESFKSCQDYDLWMRLVGSFGPCKRISKASYYMYIGDAHNRISTSNNKKIGHEQFIHKHMNSMSKSAIRSFTFITKLQVEKEVGVTDLINNFSLPIAHIQIYIIIKRLLLKWKR